MAPAFLIASLKGEEKRFAQHALGNIGRRAVHAGLGLTVAGEVLQRRDHALPVVERRVALKTAHRGDSHARDQIRDLRRRFLRRVPSADRARHRLPALAPGGRRDAGFFGGHGEQALDQVGIECRCQGRSAGESWSPSIAAWPCRHSSWNITGMPRRLFFEEELLDGVGEFGHLRGHSESAAGIAGAAHLADRGRF